MMAYGDIKLFAGSGCPKLAQRIAEYVKIPLSSWDIIEFPNENLLVKLHGSVRGQDVYLIQSHARPVHRNIMEMLIAIDCFKRDSAGELRSLCPTWPIRKATKKTSRACPSTARLLADMIEVAGADRWMTIDLHAGPDSGLLQDSRRFADGLHIMLVDYFAREESGCVVVTPDLGFAKGGRNFAAALACPWRLSKSVASATAAAKR
jgi:ribose-phosphate pyrophosphokinase